MNEGQEVPRSLVIACCNPTKPLDFIDETLNKVSLRIDVPVHFTRLFAVLLWRNYHFCAFRLNLPYKFIAVVSLVSHNYFWLMAFN